jgi:hypothetical protein
MSCATSCFRVTFFVDSGAGQCLCSVSTAFSDLQPCRVEVTGVSGSLPIYGCGTANLVALDHNGNPLVIRIPNCLYGRCEFNLLSVSQFNQVGGNRIDFSLDAPAMVLAPPSGVLRPSARVPLVLEDGLYALHLEPWGKGIPVLGPSPSIPSLSRVNMYRATLEVMCGGKRGCSQWHPQPRAYWEQRRRIATINWTLSVTSIWPPRRSLLLGDSTT